MFRDASPRSRLFVPALETLETRDVLSATGSQYVGFLYQDILGRSPADTERAYWAGVLDSGVPSERVARFILDSPESARPRIRDLFSDYFNRSPESSALNFYTNAFLSGSSLEQLAVEFAVSEEYFALNGRSAAGFISGLYEDFLDRQGESTGLAFWLNEFARGASRRDVANGFLNSPEGRNLRVELVYVDVLNRSADAGGRTLFANAFSRGATVAGLAAALYSSEEYFRNRVQLPPAFSGDVLVVPSSSTGSVGQSVSFTLTSRQASFNDEIGVYQVDSSDGRLGSLRPGDTGYTAAALESSTRQRLTFPTGSRVEPTTRLTLPAGGLFGFYLIQDSTTAAFLAANRTNSPALSPLAFFSFTRANPDSVRHIRPGEGNTIAFEDQTDGGDRDFDDAVLQIGLPRFL